MEPSGKFVDFYFVFSGTSFFRYSVYVRLVTRSNTTITKMPTDTHDKCSKVLRSLCFDWIQDPDVVLNECLKTVGLESEYLETDFELLKFFVASYIGASKENIVSC